MIRQIVMLQFVTRYGDVYIDNIWQIAIFICCGAFFLSLDKLSLDKLSLDKLSLDKLSFEKLSFEKLSFD